MVKSLAVMTSSNAKNRNYVMVVYAKQGRNQDFAKGGGLESEKFL